MTQLSYLQAVKLNGMLQKEIERLEALLERKDDSMMALARETRGSILLNWHLVNEKGGEVRVPAATLTGISPDSKFGYRYDEATDEYVFTARIEADPAAPTTETGAPNGDGA